MSTAPDSPTPPRTIIVTGDTPRDLDMGLIHAAAQWAENLIDKPSRLCDLCLCILTDWTATEHLAQDFQRAGALLPADAAAARDHLQKLLRSGGVRASFITPNTDTP